MWAVSLSQIAAIRDSRVVRVLFAVPGVRARLYGDAVAAGAQFHRHTVYTTRIHDQTLTIHM